jgi:hypothetical protein
VQCEEASIFLAYNGFYNPAVSLLRNCLDIFLIHIYFYFKSEDDIYVKGLKNEDSSFLEWKSGGNNYPSTSKIYGKLKEKNRSEIETEKIKDFYCELSKFVHGRKNINPNGLKVGYLTNYFYSKENINKYNEFHKRLFDIVAVLLKTICKNHLKN